MRRIQQIVGLLVLAVCSVTAAAAQVQIDSNTFGGLRARAIGPAVMSGRIAAIDAVAADPLTIYVGAASGGVWKSKDAGITWKPVFDDHIQSIGAIRIDPGNPETVWVGTGETWTRNSTSVGDGLYKSTDGGDSWQLVGLADSERIARIEIDPTDGDTVYVCATGHLWNANAERGVYKTTDGGESWERVLYVDQDTGCSDLAIDPQSPNILYAGMWQFRRYPDFFESGGPGSGLYKSTDGGATWREISTGLPAGEKGRIAVAVAPSRPSRVYAVVEAEDTALYKSDDLGESWEEMNNSFAVNARPFYFAYVVVDPVDFERIYKPGLYLAVSTDSGRSFTSVMSSGFDGAVHSTSTPCGSTPTTSTRWCWGPMAVSTCPMTGATTFAWPRPCHCRSSTRSASTWSGPTTFTEDCRTTPRGRVRRAPPVASRTSTGSFWPTATASTPTGTRTIRTSSTPSTRVAISCATT
jgi:photosystem II stability/assembly factor-like uncharacterized protein